MLIHQMDVSCAFLQGKIDCTTYVNPPPPYTCRPGKAWKLKSPLYGLKQAPRCWAEKLKSIMTSLGFQQTKADKCMYVKTTNGELVYILVYVDDILIAA